MVLHQANCYILLLSPLQYLRGVKREIVRSADFQTILLFVGLSNESSFTVQNSKDGVFCFPQNFYQNLRLNRTPFASPDIMCPYKFRLFRLCAFRAELQQQLLSTEIFFDLGLPLKVASAFTEEFQYELEWFHVDRAEPMSTPFWAPYNILALTSDTNRESISTIEAAKRILAVDVQPIWPHSHYVFNRCTRCYNPRHPTRMCFLRPPVYDHHFQSPFLKALTSFVTEKRFPAFSISLPEIDSVSRFADCLKEFNEQFWTQFTEQTGESEIPSCEAFSFLLPHLGAWATIGASPSQMLQLSLGVPIWFSKLPPPTEIRTPFRSAENNQLLWDHLISDVSKGTMVRVSSNFPKMVLPSFFVQQTDKARFIFDARFLNMYLIASKFSLSTISDFLNLVHQDGLIIQFDLTSGYSQLRVSPRDMRYLCVQALDPRTNKQAFFAFTGFPFGLKTAPQKFQRFFSLVTRFFQQVFVGVQYLDNFAIQIAFASDTRQVIERRAQFCVDVFQNLGIVLNVKYPPIPTSVPHFLGSYLDPKTAAHMPSIEKYEKLSRAFNAAFSVKNWMIADAASLVGIFLSVGGKMASVWARPLRDMYSPYLATGVAELAERYKMVVPVPHALLSEMIAQWCSLLTIITFKQRISHFDHALILVCDASDKTGRGGSFFAFSGNNVAPSNIIIPPLFCENSSLVELYTIFEKLRSHPQFWEEFSSFGDFTQFLIINDNVGVIVQIISGLVHSPVVAEMLAAIFTTLHLCPSTNRICYVRRSILVK